MIDGAKLTVVRTPLVESTSCKVSQNGIACCNIYNPFGWLFRLIVDTIFPLDVGTQVSLDYSGYNHRDCKGRPELEGEIIIHNYARVALSSKV